MSTLPLGAMQSMSTMLIPIIVALVIGLFIAGLLVPGAKPEALGKAIVCYILKAVGVILLVIAAMQFVFALFTMTMPETSMLLVLVLVAILGIGILVHESRVLSPLDESSTVIVRLIFAYSCTTIGTLAALSAALSYIVSFFLTQQLDGWESTATVVMIGTMLSLLSSAYATKRSKPAAKKKR